MFLLEDFFRGKKTLIGAIMLAIAGVLDIQDDPNYKLAAQVLYAIGGPLAGYGAIKKLESLKGSSNGK